MDNQSHRRTQHCLRSLCTCGATLAVVATSLLGCGDDGTTTTTAALGPPSIAIKTPDEGACVVLRDDLGATVGVGLELQNWSLRPPGFCGDVYEQCGFAVFLVDDTEVARSASLAADLPFASLPSPAGNHRIRVELRNDDDVVQVDREGLDLADERNITTVAPTDTCP